MGSNGADGLEGDRDIGDRLGISHEAEDGAWEQAQLVVGRVRQVGEGSGGGGDRGEEDGNLSAAWWREWSEGGDVGEKSAQGGGGMGQGVVCAG